MNTLVSLERRGRLFWTITGIILVAGIGAVDYLTGPEISISLFYLIPIVAATWFSGRYLGIAISLLSAFAWFAADVFSGSSHSNPAIPFWNAFVRLGFFVIVTLLLPVLKALEREKELARVDDLTGAINRRFFFEVLQKELDRSLRYQHPLTVVYIDLDNFKAINDRFGHSVGDKVLRVVVAQSQGHLRRSDVVARLGGDEFVILLPETDQLAAKIIVSKIHRVLSGEMRKNGWLLTFSIGALTCVNASITPDELIKRADDLMYSIKKDGKNAIRDSVYTG
jgi:diguanylate cyclase (GGDEF)-like protein